MDDDDIGDLEKIPPFILHRIKRLAFYARRFLEEADTPKSKTFADEWHPMDTAPQGYDGQKWTHVLFKAVSKARSFEGPVYISGWMDHERKPVTNFSYALRYLGWKPLSTVEGGPS